MKISTKIEGKIAELSERFGIDPKELRQEMMDYVPQIEKDTRGLKEEQYIALAFRQLRADLQAEEGGVNSKALMYNGFFLGETGIKNTSEQMIRKIQRMTEDEQKIFHPDDKTWLDYRKDSETFMNPIEGLDHRTFYLVGSVGKELDKDRMGFGKLEAWREMVSLGPNRGTLYNFRAIPKDSNKQTSSYYLGASKITKLRPSLYQPTDEEKEDLIRNCGKEIYNLDEMQQVFDMQFDGPGFDKEPVFLEANVNNIIYREKKQTIVAVDDELESGVANGTIYMPHFIPIKFKEGDRVIFLGELSKLKYQKSGEERVVMYSKGYFALPATSDALYKDLI